MSDDIRTVPEQAKEWLRTPGFVRGLIRKGDLEAFKVSERGWRITKAAADAYLAKQAAKQPAEVDPDTKEARRAMASKMGKASAAARAARREGAATAPLPKVKKVKCKPAAAKGGAK